MRRFQPYDAVVSALRDSAELDLTGDAGAELVARKVPYQSDEESRARRLAASIYAKGFGPETPSTQFEIESFFQQYGVVSRVKLRRTENNYGDFKGSVFVEFDSEETAKKFLALDPKPTYKDRDDALVVMSKKDYVDWKSQEIADGKVKPRESRNFWEGAEVIRDSRGLNKAGAPPRRDNASRGGARGNRGGKFGGRGGGGGFKNPRGGGRQNGRGGRPNDRNRERDANGGSKAANGDAKDSDAPVKKVLADVDPSAEANYSSTKPAAAPAAEAKEASASNGNGTKRPREETAQETAAVEPAAKKVEA